MNPSAITQLSMTTENGKAKPTRGQDKREMTKLDYTTLKCLVYT